MCRSKTLIFLIFWISSVFASSFHFFPKKIFESYEQKRLATDWHREMYQSYQKVVEEHPEKEFSPYELIELGMKKEFVEQVLIEYIKEKENSYIIFLFPPISKNFSRAFSWLSQYGKLVYHKPIFLNKKGMKNLLQSIYDVHHCDGWQRTYEGIYKRFSHLLDPKKTQEILVVVWEGPVLQEAIECKRKIRGDHGGDNRIVHFTDRHFEAVHNAEVVFNQNTLDVFNRLQPGNFSSFVKYVKMLQKYLKSHCDFHDVYCVDAGGVLSACGVRDCGDFDLIIDRGFSSPFPGWGVNNVTREKYGYRTDDIIHNPQNHFYYKGLRFVSLENVVEYKEKKGSKKDQRDVALVKRKQML